MILSLFGGDLFSKERRIEAFISETLKDLKESGTTKKSDLSRLNPNHNISEDLLSKLNKFYA